MNEQDNSLQQITESFNLLPDAVLIVNRSGEIVKDNSRTLKILGYEPGELIGQPLDIIMPTQFIERHKKWVETFFVGGHSRKMGMGYKIKAIKKDGVKIDVDIALSILNQSCEAYAVAVVRDISDKLSIIDKQSNIDPLRKEMERFAYVVSHDLKSPLQRVKALAQLISLGLSEKESKDISTLISYLNESIHTMEKLIHGVIEYERIGYEEVYDEVDLNQVLEEAVRTITVPQGFRIKTSQTLPIVNGNYIKLLQVFLNLITNAIKYNKSEEGILNIEWNQSDSFLIFSFADNGTRVLPEYQKKIFHLFERASTTEKDSHGIGLSIVKRVVEGAGGSIWYEDSLLGGSCFKFTWPIKKKEV